MLTYLGCLLVTLGLPLLEQLFEFGRLLRHLAAAFVFAFLVVSEEQYVYVTVSLDFTFRGTQQRTIPMVAISSIDCIPKDTRMPVQLIRENIPCIAVKREVMGRRTMA